jgi:hypothetical protein
MPTHMHTHTYTHAHTHTHMHAHAHTHTRTHSHTHLPPPPYRQVRQVLAEADENEDNVIQYKEFLPVMVDILHSLKAKQQMQAQREQVCVLKQVCAMGHLSPCAYSRCIMMMCVYVCVYICLRCVTMCVCVCVCVCVCACVCMCAIWPTM